MSEFFKQGKSLVSSIIRQRMRLIINNRSKLDDVDLVRIETEDLRNEFEKYSGSQRTIAYFIKKNYDRLIKIIPQTNGYKHRVEKLSALYNESINLITN